MTAVDEAVAATQGVVDARAKIKAAEADLEAQLRQAKAERKKGGDADYHETARRIVAERNQLRQAKSLLADGAGDATVKAPKGAKGKV